MNDPGAKLVVAAAAVGVPVTVLPGPSAVETALVASGLAGQQYRFVGYVPRTEKERVALWQELLSWPHPTIAFESPKRLPATLASLATADPDRSVAVCRELTKLHEKVVCDSATALATLFEAPPRGEVTLVIGPSARETADDDLAVAAVVELVAAGAQRRAAARVVARLTGCSPNALYGRSL